MWSWWAGLLHLYQYQISFFLPGFSFFPDYWFYISRIRNAPDGYLFIYVYFDLPCTRDLSEMWSLWSASRPTIARPTSENIWHLSNTPTRRHLRTWSCDLLEPGSRDHTFSGGRSRAGGKMSVTLWRWFYIHILNTWTKHGIKARWRDFNHWRLKIADWCENLLCYWSLVQGPAWSASIIKCGEPI